MFFWNHPLLVYDCCYGYGVFPALPLRVHMFVFRKTQSHIKRFISYHPLQPQTGRRSWQDGAATCEARGRKSISFQHLCGHLPGYTHSSNYSNLQWKTQSGANMFR